MLIVHAPIIEEYIEYLPLGKFIEPLKMRDFLARKYKAGKTFPVPMRMFLQIVSKAYYK